MKDESGRMKGNQVSALEAAVNSSSVAAVRIVLTQIPPAIPISSGVQPSMASIIRTMRCGMDRAPD
jgi:hypothetical protein